MTGPDAVLTADVFVTTTNRTGRTVTMRLRAGRQADADMLATLHARHQAGELIDLETFEATGPA